MVTFKNELGEVLFEITENSSSNEASRFALNYNIGKSRLEKVVEIEFHDGRYYFLGSKNEEFNPIPIKNKGVKVIKAVNLCLDTFNFKKTLSFKDVSMNDFVLSSYFSNPNEKYYVKSIYVNREDDNKAMVLVLFNTDEYFIPYSSIIKVIKD